MIVLEAAVEEADVGKNGSDVPVVPEADSKALAATGGGVVGVGTDGAVPNFIGPSDGEDGTALEIVNVIRRANGVDLAWGILLETKGQHGGRSDVMGDRERKHKKCFFLDFNLAAVVVDVIVVVLVLVPLRKRMDPQLIEAQGRRVAGRCESRGRPGVSEGGRGVEGRFQVGDDVRVCVVDEIILLRQVRGQIVDLDRRGGVVEEEDDVVFPNAPEALMPWIVPVALIENMIADDAFLPEECREQVHRIHRVMIPHRRLGQGVDGRDPVVDPDHVMPDLIRFDPVMPKYQWGCFFFAEIEAILEDVELF